MKKRKINTIGQILAGILGWGIVVLLMMYFGYDLSNSWPEMVIGLVTYVICLSTLLYLINKT